MDLFSDEWKPQSRYKAASLRRQGAEGSGAHMPNGAEELPRERLQDASRRSKRSLALNAHRAFWKPVPSNIFAKSRGSRTV